MPELTLERYGQALVDQTASSPNTARQATVDAPVPTCPEWTQSQLVEHVNLHSIGLPRSWSSGVSDPSQVPTSFAALPSDQDAWASWLAEGASRPAVACVDAGADARPCGTRRVTVDRGHGSGCVGSLARRSSTACRCGRHRGRGLPTRTRSARRRRYHRPPGDDDLAGMGSSAAGLRRGAARQRADVAPARQRRAESCGAGERFVERGADGATWQHRSRPLRTSRSVARRPRCC